MTTATNPSAVRSSLAAIATVANTVTSTFNVVTDTVGMLDALVSKASVDQRKRYDKEAKLFDKQLAHELSREISEMKRSADEYLAKNPELAPLYNETYNSFLAELNSKYGSAKA